MSKSAKFKRYSDSEDLCELENLQSVSFKKLKQFSEKFEKDLKREQIEQEDDSIFLLCKSLTQRLIFSHIEKLTLNELETDFKTTILDTIDAEIAHLISAYQYSGKDESDFMLLVAKKEGMI